MPESLRAFSGFLLTGWGVFLLSALDASVFFFLPFGNDALVVYVVARNRDLFWMYALAATLGSTVGAAVTYWIGLKAGEAGLPRLVAERRLSHLKRRVREAGAFAVALPAALPPPFPLTPFLLTCGALEVDPRRLLVICAGTRLVRFGAEAMLARRYGDRVLTFVESEAVGALALAVVLLAIAGTAVSIAVYWRRSRPLLPG